MVIVALLVNALNPKPWEKVVNNDAAWLALGLFMESLSLVQFQFINKPVKLRPMTSKSIEGM